ncbi:MAG: hypothetical protein AABP62_21845 [Planctomycetota bacterium]
MFELLAQRLCGELTKVVLIDPHTHINPHSAAAKTLADIMGYHYYTELAHSAGMLDMSRAIHPLSNAMIPIVCLADLPLQRSVFLPVGRLSTNLVNRNTRSLPIDCFAFETRNLQYDVALL